MTNFKYVITDEVGIHARPAGLLVKEAKKYASKIVIVKGEPEPEPQYEDDYPDFMSMRFLYGCPMAQSVEEAINQAEKYTDDDSYVTTGHINFD